jgi:hypothetical protein
MVSTRQIQVRRHTSVSTNAFSQTAKGEKIWNAAEAGDDTLLQQYLTGATAEDLTYERDQGLDYPVRNVQNCGQGTDHPVDYFFVVGPTGFT